MNTEVCATRERDATHYQPEFQKSARSFKRGYKTVLVKRSRQSAESAQEQETISKRVTKVWRHYPTLRELDGANRWKMIMDFFEGCRSKTWEGRLRTGRDAWNTDLTRPGSKYNIRQFGQPTVLARQPRTLRWREHGRPDSKSFSKSMWMDKFFVSYRIFVWLQVYLGTRSHRSRTQLPFKMKL